MSQDLLDLQERHSIYRLLLSLTGLNFSLCESFYTVPADFQARANLLTGGQPFVQGFSNLILKLITTGHP